MSREFQKLDLEDMQWKSCEFHTLQPFDAFRFRDKPDKDWDKIEMCWIFRRWDGPVGDKATVDPATNSKDLWEIEVDIAASRKKQMLRDRYNQNTEEGK